MGEITLKHDGDKFTIDVDDVGRDERMRYASMAPDSLHEIAEAEDDNEAMRKASVEPEVVEYLITVATETTAFTEDQLQDIPIDTMLTLTSEILNEVLAAEGGENDDTERRLKRVRCTAEFVEGLFTEKMAIVAGMPDDASLEDFSYDPSRNELQFIFHSEQWDKVAEGAEIPCHKAYGVGLGDSTKELSPADLTGR